VRRLKSFEVLAAEMRERQREERLQRKRIFAKLASEAHAKKSRDRAYDIAHVYWHEVRRPFTPAWAMIRRPVFQNR
jgi:hypothetical protein